ncbi:hypothetical protein [Flavobacterium sp. PL002]|uniref:hypothetical protein n=1 Tax=Flavobacterium sp. PL002 TaxID=1897058 RepID=UPI001788280F|nr:hypothetical protein [Flavobacterium sp. PL002]MBE0393887.1 hypothetical protein [Flavobacterium sp. PL002]
MKKINLALVFIALTMLSACNSQTKNKSDNNIVSQEKNSNELPFDLATLTLTEDISTILSSVNLSKKDTIKNDEVTLLGNEKLVFDSEKLLVFDKTKLSSNTDKQKNNILFHYGKVDPEIGAMNNEKENILGMYQINLYSENGIQKFQQNLKSKLGKEFFEKEIAGNLSDIKDNSLIETSNKFKETIIIWKNRNLIYYCYVHQLNGINDSLNLFVFNKNSTEWIGFIGGLGYQNTEKCLEK